MTVLPLKVGTYPIAQSLIKGIKRIEKIEHQSFDCSHFDLFYRNHFVHSAKEEARVSQLSLYHVNLVFLEQVLSFKPEVVFIVSYSIILPEFIEKIKCLGVKVVFWLIDDYRLKAKISTVPNWQSLINSTDLFLSFQQDNALAEINKTAPSKTVAFMAPGFDPDDFHKKNLTHEELSVYKTKIEFCGSPYPNRINVLNEICDENITIWGQGWKTNSSATEKVKEQVEADRWLETPEENNIYNAAEICLNIHSSLEHSGIAPPGDNVNPRLFCINGAGGFQLVDERVNLDQFFIPGEELIVYRNLGELQESLDRYLKDSKERERIAENGHQRAMAEHTYEKRICTLLQEYF